MRITIVRDKITQNELLDLAQEFCVNLIKGAIDIEKEIAAFGGEYHMDARIIKEK
jgi:hypothetical protein